MKAITSVNAAKRPASSGGTLHLARKRVAGMIQQRLQILARVARASRPAESSQNPRSSSVFRSGYRAWARPGSAARCSTAPNADAGDLLGEEHPHRLVPPRTTSPRSARCSGLPTSPMYTAARRTRSWAGHVPNQLQPLPGSHRARHAVVTDQEMKSTATWGGTCVVRVGMPLSALSPYAVDLGGMVHSALDGPAFVRSPGATPRCRAASQRTNASASLLGIGRPARSHASLVLAPQHPVALPVLQNERYVSLAIRLAADARPDRRTAPRRP